MERILNKLTEMLGNEPILNKRNAYELRGNKLLMGLLLKKSGKVFLETAPGVELSKRFNLFRTRYIKDNYVSNATILKTEDDILKMLEILDYLDNNRELIRQRKNNRTKFHNEKRADDSEDFESNLINLNDYFAKHKYTDNQRLLVNSFIKNYDHNGVSLETLTNDTGMKANTVRMLVYGLVKRQLLKINEGIVTLNI